MDRRTFIRNAAALLLLSRGSWLRAAKRAVTFSRVRPGARGWPTQAEWKALSDRLQVPLIRPKPLFSDCLSAASIRCKDVIRNIANPYYIGDQPSGTQVSGWLGAWTPQVSKYCVAAHTAADVAAAVNFAREHRIRLVIKGGGHSYQGTSNAPDSLLIWTRPMQSIVLHNSFVAKDCPPSSGRPAVTVEAGAMWMDVYDAVTTKGGRYVQGGGCATVGVAGLVQSGGFGSFSKRFGTAAGSLLEAEIVTSDGIVRTVNAQRHPDLFWGVKGGGGGALGVVTKLTLETYELPTFFGGADGKIKANSDEAFERLINRFMSFYANALFNAHWGEAANFGPDNTLEISMSSQGLNTEAAQAVWEPFRSWIAERSLDYQVVERLEAGSRPARQWWDVLARRRAHSSSVTFDDRAGASETHAWWSGDQDQVGAFLYGYDSLWLSAAQLRPERREALGKAIFDASRSMMVRLHFNKALAGAPNEAIERAAATATNPDVLDAFALAIMAIGGASQYDGLPGRIALTNEARRQASLVDKAAARLRVLSPTAGSYISESNYFNCNWAQAFWGPNYPTLRRVKDRYDPDGLFYSHHGVRSENWDSEGFSRSD